MEIGKSSKEDKEENFCFGDHKHNMLTGEIGYGVRLKFRDLSPELSSEEKCFPLNQYHNL